MEYSNKKAENIVDDIFKSLEENQMTYSCRIFKKLYI